MDRRQDFLVWHNHTTSVLLLSPQQDMKVITVPSSRNSALSLFFSDFFNGHLQCWDHTFSHCTHRLLWKMSIKICNALRDILLIYLMLQYIISMPIALWMGGEETLWGRHSQNGNSTWKFIWCRLLCSGLEPGSPFKLRKWNLEIVFRFQLTGNFREDRRANVNTCCLFRLFLCFW